MDRENLLQFDWSFRGTDYRMELCVGDWFGLLSVGYWHYRHHNPYSVSFIVQTWTWAKFKFVRLTHYGIVSGEKL
jgi:hypothetical protein